MFAPRHCQLSEPWQTLTDVVQNIKIYNDFELYTVSLSVRRDSENLPKHNWVLSVLPSGQSCTLNAAALGWFFPKLLFFFCFYLVFCLPLCLWRSPLHNCASESWILWETRDFFPEVKASFIVRETWTCHSGRIPTCHAVNATGLTWPKPLNVPWWRDELKVILLSLLITGSEPCDPLTYRPPTDV